MREYLFKWWGHTYHWHKPTYRNNLWRELDFGKFSIFFGKGKVLKKGGALC
jgi:hypothetical protein